MLLYHPVPADVVQQIRKKETFLEKEQDSTSTFLAS